MSSALESSRQSPPLRFINSSAARVAAAVLWLAVTMIIAVGAIASVRDLNSDDLAWQYLLHAWESTGHAQGWISEDVFPTRFALYALLEALGFTGRDEVVVASAILNFAGALSFLAALAVSQSIRVPVRGRVVVGVGLLASWGLVAWTDVFFSPNSRSLEIGLALLAVAWLGVRTITERRLSVLALTVFALALVWFSDPFVFLVVAVPAGLAVALDALKPFRRRGSLTVLVVLALSVLLTLAFRAGLALFDLSAESVARGGYFLTPLGEIPHRALAILERSAILLGLGQENLTQGSALDLLVAVLRLGVLGLALAGLIVTVREWGRASLLARTLGLSLIACPAAMIFINIYPDPAIIIDRYLVMVLVALAGLALIALDRARAKAARVSGVLVAVLVLAVLVTNFSNWRENNETVRDANAIALGDAVSFQEWDRVYANYWMAVRQNEVAPGNARWVPVTCDRNGPLELFKWNNDSSVLRTRPKTIAVSVERQYCDSSDIARLYGPPTDQVALEGHEFFVYRDRSVSPALRTLRP